MSQQLFTRSSMSDSRRLKSDILDFLRRHGASRVSSLTEELGVSRGQVQYQLSLLEAEALVLSDRPSEQRQRFTPFYRLAQRNQ